MSSDDKNTLTREGEYWTFHYRGAVCRLGARVGLAYLEVLLERPHEEVPAVTLAAGPALHDTVVAPARQPTDLRVEWPADLGDVLDPRAHAEYRERLADLRAQLDEAEQAYDLGQTERLREEIETLQEALTSALGLGGRARRTGSPAERARVRVTRALRKTIDRVRAVDKGLGDHLARSVRTGTYCSYAPPEPTTWTVERKR